MLNFLKINNIALISELKLEFSAGLNLLTGETGSGKSIIIDSLNALTGERVFSDIIKQNETEARIEGLFSVFENSEMLKIFEESGVEVENEKEVQIIVRREISSAGKNRIFVNNQLVTQSFLRKIGTYLVDIHGQGEQSTLFNPTQHLEILDEFANLENLRLKVAEKFRNLSEIEKEVENLQADEAQKLQLLDVLQFQTNEIKQADLQIGEDEALEEEKRRLNNIEKLSILSEESYSLLYENEESVVVNLERIIRKINDLAEFEESFEGYREGLNSAQAVLEDLAISVRSFRSQLEFSPTRLEEIENRLAEISRLKRKYGGTIENILEHFQESEKRLFLIEDASAQIEKLQKNLKSTTAEYVKLASDLHQKRLEAKLKFEKKVESHLKDVSLERAKFEVKVEAHKDDCKKFTAKGFDKVEFYFSANPGEAVKPIAKVASGGELSRLMLVLNTTSKVTETPKTMVFDEIDTGIGGRVAEAVGLKLKSLSKNHQVLCVTHQPQVAALANHHYLVIKNVKSDKTSVSVKKLDEKERVEEVSRMLAGGKITETARQHAKELLAQN